MSDVYCCRECGVLYLRETPPVACGSCGRYTEGNVPSHVVLTDPEGGTTEFRIVTEGIS